MPRLPRRALRRTTCRSPSCTPPGSRRRALRARRMLLPDRRARARSVRARGSRGGLDRPIHRRHGDGRVGVGRRRRSPGALTSSASTSALAAHRSDALHAVTCARWSSTLTTSIRGLGVASRHDSARRSTWRASRTVRRSTKRLPSVDPAGDGGFGRRGCESVLNAAAICPASASRSYD